MARLLQASEPDEAREILPPVCAHEGCEKPVPPTALAHHDPFCSTTCFKASRAEKSE